MSFDRLIVWRAMGHHPPSWEGALLPKRCNTSQPSQVRCIVIIMLISGQMTYDAEL